MIVNYDPNGGLSGYATIDVEGAYGPVQFSITIHGTFSAQMPGPNAIIVTPNAQYSMFIPGQVPNKRPGNTPMRLTILSPTSFQDDDGVVYTKQKKPRILLRGFAISYALKT